MKIKLTHLLNYPQDYREKRSILDFKRLSMMDARIFYHQNINQTYTEIPPEDNVFINKVVGKEKTTYSAGLSSGHYGCFLAHRSAIINFYDNDDSDLLLVVESDTKLNYRASYIKEKVILAAKKLIELDDMIFSFSNHNKKNTAFIKNHGQEIFSVDSFVSGQMYMIHKKNKNFFKTIFDKYGWGAFDLWLQKILKMENKNILCYNGSKFISEHIGRSQIDRIPALVGTIAEYRSGLLNFNK